MCKHRLFLLALGKSLLFSTSDTLITNQSVDEVGDPFHYSPLELRLCGPALPSPEEMAAFARGLEPATPQGLLGGGFHAEIAVARALTDAFSGLFMFGAHSAAAATAVGEPKRRKTDHMPVTTSAAHEPLNESSVMETSMMANAQTGDVSLMDVSLMNTSRMSLS